MALVNRENLKNYRALVLEVKDLKARLREFEESMYSPTHQRYTSTPRAGSPKGATMDALVAKHIELERFYAERLAAKNEQLLAVEKAIEALASPVERLVLRLRYVDGLDWVPIIMRLQRDGYSERQVYRIHGWALLKVEEVE